MDPLATKAAPPARLSAAEDLARQLAQDIIEGDLLPGIRLEEEPLAARFGVSRTPVREALHHLEGTGLVERRPRRGMVVSRIGRGRLDAMFEAMAELEAAAARLSALRMSSQESGALMRAHLDSRVLVDASDHRAYERFNRAFHERIYDGTKNPELAAITRAMRLRVAPFRRAQFELTGRLLGSFTEHGRVAACIARRDGDAAAREMRAHLLLVSDASTLLRAVRPDP
ncbi:GntR family transcriptional regulator [Lichenicoccus sp.]|uniref:GntR family transcriptional regulator n=1 Tax=Lichenicoccus sp. TaxID=2781899 RepID=UPI003D128C44